MKNIPILFQGGSYGTYLAWIIDTLFSDRAVIDPFVESTGTSHLHRVPYIKDIEQWRACPVTYNNLTVKVHPKLKKQHFIVDNINAVTNFFGRSILLYPSSSSYLLHCNNFAYKIWTDLWSGPLVDLNLRDLYDNFPVEPDTPPHDIPKWIVREWLSYCYFDAVNAQLEWFLPDRFDNKNCLVLFIDDLLHNLEFTVQKIQTFVELPLHKEINTIIPLHQKNLSNQKYLTQDHMFSKIVDAVANHQLLCWNSHDITLITEARLQEHFRNSGLTFKCHGLDYFPTSAAELINCLEK